MLKCVAITHDCVRQMGADSPTSTPDRKNVVRTGPRIRKGLHVSVHTGGANQRHCNAGYFSKPVAEYVYLTQVSDDRHGHERCVW